MKVACAPGKTLHPNMVFQMYQSGTAITSLSHLSGSVERDLMVELSLI